VEYFPYGKTFAVAFVDDTDLATLPKITPVYRYLDDHGILSTKTVWTLPAICSSGSLPYSYAGTTTLQDADYRRYCEWLQGRGFEIAMHTASGGDNVRERTIEAYALFEDIFGHPPHTNIMHGRNRENLYWGKHSVPHPLLRRIVGAFEPQDFSGHRPDSEYFWGDVCEAKTRYVRVFDTLETNTLAFDPATPYHDPAKPHVPWWFSASFANGWNLFSLLSREKLEALRAQRGASIVHLYCGDYGSRLDSNEHTVSKTFSQTIDQLASFPDGWYVPVVELFDRIRAVRGLTVTREGDAIEIRNNSEIELRELALHVTGEVAGYDALGESLTRRRNAAGQIPVGDLQAGGGMRLRFAGAAPEIDVPVQQSPDYPKLVMGTAKRIAWQFKRGRRHGGWGAYKRIPGVSPDGSSPRDSVAVRAFRRAWSRRRVLS
jgi:hypothetical protein